MNTPENHRNAAYRRAEQLLTAKEHKEGERVSDRENERRKEDEKIARLRALRLAKEAAEQSAAQPVAPRAGKKRPPKSG
ncbi:MAG TPA: hypothetical protein VLV50_17805 [Stellaceae bacterium]|nr:hypothetical protein [Stellaceae bacterium]